jgi:hypothetical protein
MDHQDIEAVLLHRSKLHCYSVTWSARIQARQITGRR